MELDRQTNVQAQYGLWAQMGLLDDAIREHLELKRLRGADPGDVAREEQAALGPAPSEAGAEPDGPEDGETIDQQVDESSRSRSEVNPAIDPSTAGQETIEINMEAELTASDLAGRNVAPASEQETPVGRAPHAPASAEDSLEWEMPGDRRNEPPGGEASSKADDPGVEGEHEEPESIEDVLEETPDFLRDTPEQERLWFEQRPPRDFDFNE